jgi:putative Holliday junction resolvase
MGRWIGVDYGLRRIGLACADPRGRIATPADVLNASGSASENADQVLRWAARNDAAGLVVGLPLNMDGTDSQQTRLVREFAAQLRQRGELPVELWDERLSSFQADLMMEAARLRPARRARLRDAIAAQVILQSFLDARQNADGSTTDEEQPGQ